MIESINFGKCFIEYLHFDRPQKVKVKRYSPVNSNKFSEFVYLNQFSELKPFIHNKGAFLRKKYRKANKRSNLRNYSAVAAICQTTTDGTFTDVRFVCIALSFSLMGGARTVPLPRSFPSRCRAIETEHCMRVKWKDSVDKDYEHERDADGTFFLEIWQGQISALCMMQFTIKLRA